MLYILDGRLLLDDYSVTPDGSIVFHARSTIDGKSAGVGHVNQVLRDVYGTMPVPAMPRKFNSWVYRAGQDTVFFIRNGTMYVQIEKPDERTKSRLAEMLKEVN